MNTLHLAGPDDAGRILPLMAAFHAEEGLDLSDAHRAAALQPILDGSPLGQAFLIGPRIAPVGYMVLTIGWSIEFGGKDAFIDELFIRPSVRGRGLGTEAMNAAALYLTQNGVKALHLEVDHDNQRAISTYEKTGFERRDRYGLMSRMLA